MDLTGSVARSGVACYVGVPGSGKTTRALSDLWALCRVTGRPALVIDSAEVAELASVPRVASRHDLAERLWKTGEHCRYVPKGPEDLAPVLRAVRDVGGCNVLIDEAHYWISARSRSIGGEALLPQIMRGHRHSACWLLLTTHHLTADLSQEAVSCAPVLCIFRCTSPRVLDTLEKEWGLPRSEVAALERFRYFEVRPGFAGS